MQPVSEDTFMANAAKELATMLSHKPEPIFRINSKFLNDYVLVEGLKVIAANPRETSEGHTFILPGEFF